MKKLILLSIALLIIFSCEKDNPTDISYNPLESEIYFYPIELYENYDIVDAPDLKLVLMTESYIGGGILHCTKSVVNHELRVRLNGVENSPWFIEPAPAIAYLDLPENVNKITLINGDQVDKYDVFISEEKVEIDSIVKNYTVLIYDKIFRYPENTFNFTCWTDSTDTTLCTDYLNILFNELSLVEYEFSGESKIPYPYYSSTSPEHYTGVFRYEKESDFNRAGELLEAYTLEHIQPNDGKGISLIGWNNKQFHSYIFY